MVPEESPLLAIGYKQNSLKVLSFVATAGVGSTTIFIPYLSKYPDQFSIVSIRPVDHPLLMYNVFGWVNEVESHNNSHQQYLAMGNFLVKMWLAAVVYYCCYGNDY